MDTHSLCFYYLISNFGILGFWVYTIVDVAKSKFADDTSKIVWLLVVLLTGIIGSIVYWIFGRSSRLMEDKI